MGPHIDVVMPIWPLYKSPTPTFVDQTPKIPQNQIWTTKLILAIRSLDNWMVWNELGTYTSDDCGAERFRGDNKAAGVNVVQSTKCAAQIE